jgi:hypothetical protein
MFIGLCLFLVFACEDDEFLEQVGGCGFAQLIIRLVFAS